MGKLEIAFGFALSALLVAGIESRAHACSRSASGINNRSVWPSAGNPPTNTRLVVTYGVSWPTVPFPPLGSDVALLDTDGTAVAITVEVLGSDVIIRPSAPLLPNHGYQIADRRTIPCDLPGTCEQLAATPAVFASFTTGATEDGAAPSFAGLTRANTGERSACHTPGSCCAVYEVNEVALAWGAATDDVAGADVRYNVYRRDGIAPRTPVATFVSGTQLNGAMVCSGSWIGLTLPAGTYAVRAVDWAGNEDTNTREVQVSDACADGVFSCSVARAKEPAPWLAIATIAGGIALLLFASPVRRSRRRTR